MHIGKHLVYTIRTFFYPSYCFDCGGKVEPFREFCHLCSSFVQEEPVPAPVENVDKAIGTMFTCFSFENEVVRNSVHAIKYGGFPAPSKELLQYRLDDLPFNAYDAVVPIPLHWRRKQWRGYNQAELLGRVVVDHLNIELVNPLKRTKYTKTQTRKKRWERKGAMKQVFAIRKKFRDEVEGKRFLLIDDVCTTGATAMECAEILKDQGASAVDLLTLARA